MPQTETCPRCAGTGKIACAPIRALRIRAGLGQGPVAKHLGIKQSAYSRLEAGQINPGIHAGKLADFYKVSADVVLGRAPMPAPKPARTRKDPPAGAIAAAKARRGQVKAKNKAKR